MRDAAHHAVGAEEGGFQQPQRPRPSLFQHPLKALRQAEQRSGDGVLR